MQDMAWTKATWWSDDQHLKQDLRSTREDLRYQAKSKHEDRNQAVRKIAKKQAHIGDRPLDRPLEESNRTLRSVARQQQASATATGRWISESTGRIDGTVHQSGNTLSKWPDAGGKPTRRRTTTSDRVERGYRAANLWPNASGGKWPDVGSVRSVVHGSNGRDDRTRPVSSRKAGFHPQRLLS